MSYINCLKSVTEINKYIYEFVTQTQGPNSSVCRKKNIASCNYGVQFHNDFKP